MILAAVERLSASTASTSDITVHAIAREAGISRTAFYAHFSDIDDLAVSMLIDTFREIGIDDVHDREASAVAPRELAQRSMLRLAQHIVARRLFYRASLDWRLTARVRETVEQTFADQVLATLDAARGLAAPDADPRDAARFVAGGSLSVITSWLREDVETSDPHTLAQRLVSVLPDWLLSTA